MSDPPKKFTFGFSKVVKKSNLVAPPQAAKEKKENVQFIECMEANSIKLKEGEEEENVKAPLVIPIIGPRKSSTLTNGRSIAEIVEDFSDVGVDTSIVKKEVTDVSLSADSLEALAAREILQEGADTLKEKPESTLEALPKLDTEEKEKLQKESTLEDYENIPVNQFGLAMLRGMGWKPDEGIGKNSKLVAVTAPQVRPKGMGLGADKMLLAAAAAAAKTANKKDEEELKLVKGAYVKVAAGMNKDQYAQVEGFSDDSGRVVLKMAIGGHVLSVNEATIILVSKSDYTKNSKVLNAAKFDSFKKKDEAGSSSLNIKKRSSSPEERGRRQSPSLRVVRKNELLSPKKEKSWSPKRKEKKNRYSSKSRSRSPERTDRIQKKEKYFSKSKSRSPERSDRKKKNRNKDYRDISPSPYRSQSKRGSPSSHLQRNKNSSSVRRRSSSGSPDRSSRYRSPTARRSRSREGSPSRSKYSNHRKQYSDSDSDSQTQEKKKKKKKHKERRRSSSSEEYSRSRSRSPKAKRKEKKSKRSCSRSPSSRRRR